MNRVRVRLRATVGARLWIGTRVRVSVRTKRMTINMTYQYDAPKKLGAGLGVALEVGLQ